MNEQQLREWREFADHMGSDISVLSIQYKLAKMVWSLCDEVTRLNEENTALSAKLDAVPVEAILYMLDPWTHETSQAGADAHWQQLTAWAKGQEQQAVSA